MANVLPLKLFDTGSGNGELREMAIGDGEWWVVSPYCTVGGGANALELSLQHGLGKPSAYRAGQQFRFRATSANTAATTINVAGLGAKPAVTVTGAALPGGYIRTDVDTTITYDSVGDRFVVDREIERGINANGVYVRWADGSARCTRVGQVAVIAAANTATDLGLWTFPAPFAAGSAPALSFNVNDVNSVNDFYINLRGRFVGPTTTSVIMVASVAQTYTLQSTANGSWYL